MNLAAGATAKQSSYTGSGNAKKANAQAAFTKVAAAIDSILPTLPIRGPAGTNTARSTAFRRRCTPKKGTLKGNAIAVKAAQQPANRSTKE